MKNIILLPTLLTIWIIIQIFDIKLLHNTLHQNPRKPPKTHTLYPKDPRKIYAPKRKNHLKTLTKWLTTNWNENWKYI